MLRSIVICPGHDLLKQLLEALQASEQVQVNKIADFFPPSADILRAVRAHATEVVFLSFESIEHAQELIKELQQKSPGLQFVAVHPELNAEVMHQMMRLGVREVLTKPFSRQSVIDSLSHVKELLEANPIVHASTDKTFCFLPSKAGVGTSTIAMNVSSAISRRDNTQVLLSDFDLNSGMLRFMLKLTNTHSVIDALEHMHRMEDDLWAQMVTNFGKLDLLHSGPVNPNIRIDTEHLQSLLEFMRRYYQVLCFDLSGNLERYSIELMQDSKMVLLVCTPEISSLHLAREKVKFLNTVNLGKRISVLLNRMHKKVLFTKERVEELVEAPVIETFPNDYVSVNRAIADGTFVAPKSTLGVKFTAFGDKLIDRKPAIPMKVKRNFLEFFTTPQRAIAPADPPAASGALVSVGSKRRF